MALVALTLQLALSFGHVHGEDHGHAPEIAALTADGSAGGHPDSPAGHHDHNYCAIYAVLSLLTGAQTAAAPALPMPAAAAAATVVAEPATIRASRSRAAFQSRAPPLS